MSLRSSMKVDWISSGFKPNESKIKILVNEDNFEFWRENKSHLAVITRKLSFLIFSSTHSDQIALRLLVSHGTQGENFLVLFEIRLGVFRELCDV